MDYSVNKKIDYLVFRTENMDFTSDYYITSKEEYSRIKMYDKTITYDCGMEVHQPIDRKHSHCYVICSGETLDNMRINFSDIELLKMLQESNPQYSRIDLAVTSWREDNRNHELNPHIIASLAHAGKCDTRLKTDNHVANPDLMIETAYIGSRASRNRLFRAYDKGVQMDLDRHKVVRYELQTNKHPNKIVQSVRNGADIGAIIRKYVDFPSSELWIKIMGSEVHSVHHNETPHHDQKTKAILENASRWQWLIDSCSSTIAKAMAEDFIHRGMVPDANWNIDEFARQISLKYNSAITNKFDKA